MKKEINFKAGVRGKYAGQKMVIVGATAETPKAKAAAPKNKSLVVKIDTDIADVFKTPEAVNNALRHIIEIMAVTNR